MPLLKVMFTMVIRTGMMSCAQSLSSHVGMGSSSQELTGDDFNSTPISVSVLDSNAVNRHVCSRHVWGSPSM